MNKQEKKRYVQHALKLLETGTPISQDVLSRRIIAYWGLRWAEAYIISKAAIKEFGGEDFTIDVKLLPGD